MAYLSPIIVKNPFISLLSIVLIGGARLLAADTEAPVITSIAISPNSVEVSSGPQTITVTLQITDDEEGFAEGYLYLWSGNDKFIDSIQFGPDDIIAPGTPQSGTYEVTVEVPGYGTPGAPGSWYFEAYVRDGTYNSRSYGDSPGEEEVPADATFTVTNTDPPDTGGPVASNIVFSPLSVSNAAAPATISVTFDAADTPSGYDYGYIYIQDPNGEYLYDNFIPIDASNRTSGDEFSGSYEATTTIAQGSLTGTWKVQLGLRDKLGNYSFSPLVDIEVTGLPGSLANALDAVQYDWSTSSPGWSHQTLVTHDGVDAAASEPIGDDENATFETTVTGPGTLSFHWKVSSEEFADILTVDIPSTSDHEEISGEVDWEEVELSIPPGDHTVIWTYSKNSMDSDGADGAWVDQIRFLADSDIAPPVLQSVRISPNFINTSQGSQTVTVTIEASDDYNGIFQGRVELFDPSGNSYDYSYFPGYSPDSGDSNYGTWELSFDIYGGAETGTWRVEVELEEDVTSDTVYYGPFAEAFPNAGEEFFTVANGGGGGDAPLLEEISMSAATVDVSSGPDTFVVTLRVTDQEGDFSYGDITLHGPSDQILNFTFSPYNTPYTGDEYDGTYEITCTVPQYSEPGTWALHVSLRDNNDNYREYPTDTSYNLPEDPTVLVVNTSGEFDTQDPEITSFQVSSNAVDPSSGPVSVTVDITLTDGPTGSPSGLGNGYFYLTNASGSYVPDSYINLDDAAVIRTGDAVNGTYQFLLEFPMGTTNGVYRVVSVLRDKAGNEVLYGFSFGTPLPGPGSAEITVGPLTDSTFAAFASNYSLIGNHALPASNPDFDWANNALELLLGLDPTMADVPDPSLYKVTRVGNELQLDFKIASGLIAAVDGNYLNVSDGGSSPFKLTGQTHSALSGEWTNTLPVPVGGGVYRVSLTMAPGSNGFCRLMFLDP